ncbi:RNA polymerase sigma factor [Desulfosporosinus sp. SB140]|uniref:RNA polymerase sigma factor n=1 Tax=Desulfosporosinus paludis TaxID=3115649 RepID=UPI00388F53A7
MNIKYEFLTGETLEIEVTDDIGGVSIELDREIYNSDHRETRRHKSVENLQEQGIQLIDQKADVISTIEKLETSEILQNALAKLLPQQRELIQKVFFESRSIVTVAEELGITKQACNNRLNKIYKQLKKYL